MSRINPTLRGFLIIAAIAAVVVALQLQSTLTALFVLARIAFLLAIAFFVYLVWRERLLRKFKRLGERQRSEKLEQGWTLDEEQDAIVPPGWIKAANDGAKEPDQGI